MESTYKITEAQKHLPEIVKHLDEIGTVTITVHKKTKAFMVSTERMKSILETIDIMSSANAVKAIEKYRNGLSEFLSFSEFESAIDGKE
jgi:rRNA processing protein Krr1/Pno1